MPGGGCVTVSLLKSIIWSGAIKFFIIGFRLSYSREVNIYARRINVRSTPCNGGKGA
jgi:hypothetical protein